MRDPAAGQEQRQSGVIDSCVATEGQTDKPKRSRVSTSHPLSAPPASPKQQNGFIWTKSLVVLEYIQYPAIVTFDLCVFVSRRKKVSYDISCLLKHPFMLLVCVYMSVSI